MKAISSESSSIDVIWENISVHIDRTRSYHALDKASGYARRGNILAVMGPSQSGKTTLLRVLSGRTIRKPLVFNASSGYIYLNQQRITDRQILIEHSACVEAAGESSSVIASVTVYEYLLFETKLRWKSKISDTDRFNRIHTLLRRLQLDSCRDNSIEYLSYEQARRLALASALLTNPSILYFDDFDTNLDPGFAFSLLRYLHSLKKTIIVVLQQPTARMFTCIDDLCVFATNGRCLYMGPYDQALSAFHIQCPLDVSPGDFFLEQASSARPTNPVVKSISSQSILEQQLLLIRGSRNVTVKTTPLTARRSPSTNFFQQIYWLMWRSIKPHEWKFLLVLLLQSCSIAVIYGLLDLGIERTVFTQRAPQNVAGILFRLLVLITRLCSLITLSKSSIDYHVLERESKEQRLYSIMAYYLSKFLVDLPLFAIITFLSTGIVVLLTGFQDFLLLYAIEMITALCSAAFASVLLATVNRKEYLVLAWLSLSQLLISFSGIFINTRSIPILLKWIQYSSFYYYGFSLSLISQWNHIDYMSCPMKTDNTTAMRCYSDGDSVLHQFNVDTTNQIWYWATLAFLTVFFHLLSYLILQLRLRK